MSLSISIAGSSAHPELIPIIRIDDANTLIKFNLINIALSKTCHMPYILTFRGRDLFSGCSITYNSEPAGYYCPIPSVSNPPAWS